MPKITSKYGFCVGLVILFNSLLISIIGDYIGNVKINKLIYFFVSDVSSDFNLRLAGRGNITIQVYKHL